MTDRRRARIAANIAAVCGVGAIGFGMMTAGVGMSRLPAEGIRLTVPKYITATDDEGRSVTLFTPFDGEALVEGEIVRPDVLDSESHVPGRVPVDAETASIIPGEAPPRNRVVRGAGVGVDREAVEFHDLIVPYIEYTGDQVLPETTDMYGERTAARNTSGAFVQTDDPAVTRIFPAYNSTLRSPSGAEEEVPQWDLEFDLAAAHALGRTNLPLPLGWYSSPLAHGLEVMAPWLLGGSIVAGVAASVIAVRAHRRDDGLLRT